MDYEEEVSRFLSEELLPVAMNMAILDEMLESDEYKGNLQKRIEIITQYTVANISFAFLCGKYGRENAIAYLNKTQNNDEQDIEKLFSDTDLDWLNGIIQ